MKNVWRILGRCSADRKAEGSGDQSGEFAFQLEEDLLVDSLILAKYIIRKLKIEQNCHV